MELIALAPLFILLYIFIVMIIELVFPVKLYHPEDEDGGNYDL